MYHKKVFSKCIKQRNNSSETCDLNNRLVFSPRLEEDATENAQLLAHNPTRVQKSDVFCKSLFFTLYSLIFCILILGVAALLTCYLIILPITNGFSNLFSRLFITFHIAILIVGALIYVVYKIFIEQKEDSSNQRKKDRSPIEWRQKDNTRQQNRSKKRHRKKRECTCESTC